MNTSQLYQNVRRAFLVSLLAGLGSLPSFAQFTFNSGSTGSLGALNVTSNTTLDMQTLAPDGKFNYTTINVAAGATLKFTPNALNTPVYLLATGDVTIAGTIDVSGAIGTTILGGAGGPGGFAGGKAGYLGLPAGDGHGPGAGKAGTSDAISPSTTHAGFAGYGSAGGANTAGSGAIYGSPLLLPLVGGSGGGGRPSLGGSGGGGAILIASNTEIQIAGNIIARNGTYTYGADGLGSGGAIRLVSPIVGGNGLLDTSGKEYWGNSAGSGRIRIDCMNRRLFNVSCLPSSKTTLGANMVSFLSTPPHLDITQAAGNNIPGGAPAFFMLPTGSSTSQNVTVQASDFGAVVPIRVVLTPDNGSSSSYDAQIDNTAAGSASVTVNVVVPVNVQVHVEAWTR